VWGGQNLKAQPSLQASKLAPPPYCIMIKRVYLWMGFREANYTAVHWGDYPVFHCYCGCVRCKEHMLEQVVSHLWLKIRTSKIGAKLLRVA
jgi:hypothetical protein